jgi:cytoskeletal protein CcmA (bactofilin family)
MEFFKKDKPTGRIPPDSGRAGAVDIALEPHPASASAPVARPAAREIREAVAPPAEVAPPPVAHRVEPPAPRAEPAPRPTSTVARETVINADACFKGDFSSDGAMRIDGKVEGKITTKGRLTIGKGAQVVGESSVAQAVIEGTLNGNLTASERVELASSARVTGDIRAPRLVVGEGAVLQGNVSIGSDLPAADSGGTTRKRD